MKGMEESQSVLRNNGVVSVALVQEEAGTCRPVHRRGSRYCQSCIRLADHGFWGL
jgi:hypothetical protein